MEVLFYQKIFINVFLIAYLEYKQNKEQYKKQKATIDTKYKDMFNRFVTVYEKNGHDEY